MSIAASTIERPLVRGVVAGAVGGALMSVSTNLEMRWRGRLPSRVPAKAVERVLGVDLDERQERALVTAGHAITSGMLGAVRGAFDLAGVSTRAANASLASLVLLPDFVLLPALGSAPPPWRWDRVEIATSALHHGVYTAGTTLAYRLLG
jgi:hypothetical protein